MAFMMVLLVFLLGVTVWAFFHMNPKGVSTRTLALYNTGVLVIAVLAAYTIGRALYADAVVVKAGQAGMAVYLTIMASSTAFLILVLAGGVIRNFFVFPVEKRARVEPPAS